MFPVFSWIALEGKCRDCKEKISAQYPLVELATGILFVSLACSYLSLPVILSVAKDLSLLNIVSFFFWLAFAALLIVIFVFDAKHQIIPDEAIYPALTVGLVYVSTNSLFQGNLNYLGNHILAGLLAGGFFFFLVAVSRGKWMGGGDIKLAAFMGLILGGVGVLVALYISFILGALVGLFLMAVGKKKMGSKIAFGPFLIIGTFTAFFFTEYLVKLYLNMLS